MSKLHISITAFDEDSNPRAHAYEEAPGVFRVEYRPVGEDARVVVSNPYRPEYEFLQFAVMYPYASRPYLGAVNDQVIRAGTDLLQVLAPFERLDVFKME